MQSQYAFGLKLLKRLKLAAADLQMKVQARRIKKNSGGGLPSMKYGRPPWLADKENFSFHIV